MIVENDKKIKFICSFFYGIALIQIAIMFVAAFNQSLWADEVYTLRIIELPYREMVELLTIDVHPPFYYIYLKFFVKLITSISNLSVITAAKMISIIPIVLLVFVSKRKVAKNWGEVCGALFALFITSMPNMFHYGIEVRMYSLSLLLVTLCFVYAYNTANRPSPSNFIFLTAFSVLCVYSHYFAGIAAMVVYALLFIWFIYKKDKRHSLYLIISGLCVSIIFFPWIPTAINGLRIVRDGFWVPALTAKSIRRIFLAPFSAGTNIHTILLAFLSLLFTIFHLTIRAKNNTKKEKINKYFVIAGILVFLLTSLLGICVSILYKPVITPRYIIPTIGCLWLSVAIAASNNPAKLFISDNRRKRIYISICIFILVVVISTTSIINIRKEFKNYKKWEDTSILFDSFDENDTIMTDFSHIAGISGYRTRAEIANCLNPDWVALAFFPDLAYIKSFDNISELKEKHDNIWCLISVEDTAYNLVKYLENNGFEYQNMGIYSFEQYSFTVIRIE